MAAVGFVVALPVTLAVRGGEVYEGARATASAAPVAVGERQRDRRLGVALRVPRGWERGRKAGAATYESRDGTVLVAVSAPGPARDAGRIHRTALDAARSEYRAVEVLARSDNRRVGGRPATVTALGARNPRTGAPLRLLVATAEGRRRAYLTEVFAGGREPGEAVLEAQALLDNLALEG
jgi:hypothetical protein